MKKLLCILGFALALWGAWLGQSHHQWAEHATSVNPPAVHFDPITLRQAAPHS